MKLNPELTQGDRETFLKPLKPKSKGTKKRTKEKKIIL